MSWSASTDNVDTTIPYEVYRDGVLDSRATVTSTVTYVDPRHPYVRAQGRRRLRQPLGPEQRLHRSDLLTARGRPRSGEPKLRRWRSTSPLIRRVEQPGPSSGRRDVLASDPSDRLATFQQFVETSSFSTNVSADKVLAFDQADAVLDTRQFHVQKAGGDAAAGLADFATGQRELLFAGRRSRISGTAVARSSTAR